MVVTGERPRVRWGMLWACAGAVVLIGIAIVGVLILTAYRAVDSTDPGDKLSQAVRNEIARADCAQLAKLYDRYFLNGDSVEPDATALHLTVDRQEELGCKPQPGDPLP